MISSAIEKLLARPGAVFSKALGNEKAPLSFAEACVTKNVHKEVVLRQGDMIQVSANTAFKKIDTILFVLFSAAQMISAELPVFKQPSRNILL